MPVRRHEPVDWPLPVFGLTGSIASGKSTLARALRGLGAGVIDADSTGHRLMWKGRPVYREVVEMFGPSVLGERGGIDREKLGARVFGDRRARARLEAILHPAILRAARRAAGRIASERFCVAVFEAALLMESGFDALVHDSIVVVCDPDLQVDRLARERGIDPGEARRRIRAQWSGERKAERARWVIRNDGAPGDLEHEAAGLYEKLLAHRVTRAMRRAFSGPSR